MRNGHKNDQLFSFLNKCGNKYTWFTLYKTVRVFCIILIIKRSIFMLSDIYTNMYVYFVMLK